MKNRPTGCTTIEVHWFFEKGKKKKEFDILIQ
jgi:hypothetical protein